MPVEERGLSSRRMHDVVRDQEIGQPINSEKGSETAEGITRESEGCAQLSLLCPVRQALPRGYSSRCLCPVPLQSGRAGRGWTRVRGYRGVRGCSGGWVNWRQDHGVGAAVEPRPARLGELLSGRDDPPGLPCARQLHRYAVAPVAAPQVQGQATPGRDVSPLAPLRALRTRPPDPTWARRAVGEGMRSCPRAGCGKSACPVR